MYIYTHTHVHTHTCKHIYLEQSCHKVCGLLFANSGGLCPLHQDSQLRPYLRMREWHTILQFYIRTNVHVCVCMPACV